VLGFASMPYPAVSLAGSGVPRARGEHGSAVEASIARAVEAVAAATATPIRLARYMPVIVDMSFLGAIEAEDLARTARNTPVWGTSIPWDPRSPGPSYPVVNAGPWGRDYHTPLERVHAVYAFEVLPRLVQEIARGVLAPSDPE
jgi:arginine utilization protein RocB